MYDYLVPSKHSSRDNKSKIYFYKDIERALIKKTKAVINIQQIQFFATYRGSNAYTWRTLLQAMPKLQSLELHFWEGESFFDIIMENCTCLRELILYRQRQSRASKDLEKIPSLVQRLSSTLRVLIIDSSDFRFDQKTAIALQKVVSGCKHLGD